MPRKSQAGGRRRRRRSPRMSGGCQQGEGIFGDIWNGIKSGVSSGIRYARDNKLLSGALGRSSNPYAQTAGQIAGILGFGRRRRGGSRRMMGGGIALNDNLTAGSFIPLKN